MGGAGAGGARRAQERLRRHGGRQAEVRLAAPAVDNKANKALEEFVASALGMRRNRVRLVSGHTSRMKKLIVESDVEPSWGLLGTCGK